MELLQVKEVQSYLRGLVAGGVLKSDGFRGWLAHGVKELIGKESLFFDRFHG